MTARSSGWDSRWGRPPHHRYVPGGIDRRWCAHRLSRRFADVGVHIRSARLREMLAGAPLLADESIDVPFALAATEFKREQRRARYRRARHRAAQAALMVGVALAVLNLLALFGYAFVTLALHTTEL